MRHDDYPPTEPFPDLGENLGRLVTEEPPRWWFHGLLVVPTLGVLWAVSEPGAGGDAALGWALLILAFALCWFVRLAAYVLRRRRLAYWFAVAPLCGFLVASVSDANLPMKARWAFAQDDFDRAVRELRAGGPGEGVNLPARIGTYRVLGTEAVGDGVRFVTGESFFGRSGFAWFPAGAPSEETYRHLRGDWYVFGSASGGVD